MGETANIIIADTLQGLGTDAYSGYLAHALCLSGICRLKYNGEERELRAGDLMIVRKGKLVEKIQPSEDFRVKVIYIASGFVVLSTPQNNYGMKGQLSLFLNPIMSLTTEQQELCLRDLNKWNTDSGIQTIIPSRYAYRLHTDVDTRLLRFPLPSIWREQYLCTKCFHHEPFPQHAGKRNFPRAS